MRLPSAPKTKAVIPVDLFGQMAAIERVEEAAPGVPVIEDAAQSIGAERRIGGEWVMAGERATIGTLELLSVEEPRRIRRRRHDAHAGRGPRGAAEAPASARRREDVLSRRGRVQQPARCAAGGGAAGEASAPRSVEREASRECRILRRGVRRPAGRADAVRRAVQRVDLQPVHGPRCASRRAAVLSQGAWNRQFDLLSACRSTSSRVSRTSATSRAAVRSPSVQRQR